MCDVEQSPGAPRHPSLVVESWDRSEGLWRCTWMAEIGDSSQTGLETSQHFRDQHGHTSTDWVSAAEVGLLLPRSPTESYWYGSWPCGSSAPCGDRTQASFLSLDLRSAPPGPIPRLSEPPPQVSSGLAGYSPLAPGCLLGSAWTAAASWHQQTSKLVGPVFPHGLDGGACSQSIGIIPPKQPHPVHGGRPKKEDFFFMFPLTSRTCLVAAWNFWMESHVLGLSQDVILHCFLVYIILLKCSGWFSFVPSSGKQNRGGSGYRVLGLNSGSGDCSQSLQPSEVMSASVNGAHRVTASWAGQGSNETKMSSTMFFLQTDHSTEIKTFCLYLE